MSNHLQISNLYIKLDKTNLLEVTHVSIFVRNASWFSRVGRWVGEGEVITNGVLKYRKIIEF